MSLQLNNATTQDKSRLEVWLAFLTVSGICIYSLNHILMLYTNVTVIFLIVICTASITTVRLLPRLGNDLFDPCFLFIMFVSVSILPIGIALLFGVNLLEPYSFRVKIDTLLATKSIVMHALALSVTTFTYVLLSKREQPNCFYNTSQNSIGLLSHKVWLLIYLVLFICMIFFKYFTGAFYTRQIGNSAEMVTALYSQHGLLSRQIILNVGKFTSIASIFAFGMLVSRVNTLKCARILLIVLTGLMLSYSFVLFASRGAAIIFFTAGAYADQIKWKGRLLNWRIFLAFFLGGWLGMHLVNLIEVTVLSGGHISNNWESKLFTALEPGVIRNSCVIIRWVDSMEVPLRHGSTYWAALKTLVPTQILGERVETLGTWFARTYNPEAASQGAGYNFSMIAEGYLNGKVFGVVIESIIVGLFLYGLRCIKMSRRLGYMGPILYASTIPWIYKLYRREAFLLVEVLVRNVLYISILLCLAVIMIRLGRKDNHAGLIPIANIDD